MAMHALTCPSCGASGVDRKDRQFVCTFCGSAVIPRLLPGTLCGDFVTEGRACAEPALSLCRGCARPLCDRHNDPKRYPWMEPFDPRCLRLNWSSEELSSWIRLNQIFHRFPLDGFEPFKWIRHQHMSDYAVGQLEFTLSQRLNPLVEDYGGELSESFCTFENLCTTCEKEALGRIRELVDGRQKTYRRVAYEAHAEALLAEAQQVLAYVEAFLHYPISSTMLSPGIEEPPIALRLDSPAQEWEKKGTQAKERISALELLKAKL